MRLPEAALAERAAAALPKALGRRRKPSPNPQSARKKGGRRCGTGPVVGCSFNRGPKKARKRGNKLRNCLLARFLLGTLYGSYTGFLAHSVREEALWKLKD